jgi:hypothetical protein
MAKEKPKQNYVLPKHKCKTEECKNRKCVNTDDDCYSCYYIVMKQAAAALADYYIYNKKK